MSLCFARSRPDVVARNPRAGALPGDTRATGLPRDYVRADPAGRPADQPCASGGRPNRAAQGRSSAGATEPPLRRRSGRHPVGRRSHHQHQIGVPQRRADGAQPARHPRRPRSRHVRRARPARHRVPSELRDERQVLHLHLGAQRRGAHLPDHHPYGLHRRPPERGRRMDGGQPWQPGPRCQSREPPRADARRLAAVQPRRRRPRLRAGRLPLHLDG